MKAYKALVSKGIRLGYTVSVFDGEEWQVKRSSNAADIYAAIQSVEEAQLRFRDSAGNVTGWALVSDACDLEDDETVIDTSDKEWMNI